jgi:hypothetical protein
MNLFGSILLAIFEGTNEARRVVTKSPAVMRARYKKGILNSIYSLFLYLELRKLNFRFSWYNEAHD